MKNTTLLTLVLTFISFVTYGQADYSKNFKSFLGKNEVEALNQPNTLNFDEDMSRSTTCLDTSFYPNTKADAFYFRPCRPARTGDYVIGQAYANTSKLSITGVHWYVNGDIDSVPVTVEVYAYDGKPGELLGAQLSTISHDTALSVSIDFETPVDVTGDFFVSFKLDTTRDDSINYVYDYNSGRKEHLSWVRLTDSADTWLQISEAGLDEYYGSDTESIQYGDIDYDFMVFPIFETELSATIEADDYELYPGETANFTGTVDAPSGDDSMITATGFWNLDNYIWWVVKDNNAVDFDDSTSATNYSFKFDTVGEYLVELRATQLKWRYAFSGNFHGCQDVAYVTINVDSNNTQQSINELQNEISLGQPFPNPAKEMITIPYTVSQGSEALIEIFNIAGQQVHSENMVANQGFTNYFQFNVTSLTEGTYLYSVTAGSESVSGNFNISK